MKFEEMGIKKEIIKALSEDGIKEPTKIQALSMPPIMAHKDVIGMSNTGSGKTVAFAVPLLCHVDPKQGLQSLIITPTRELAVQIKKELVKFSKHIDCKFVTIYGGVALAPQEDKLKRANIVIGTPGRLLDHYGRGNLDLSSISCVVLDEADKMVEMGFIEDIRRILDNTKKDRQILLFGATISSEIKDLRETYMRDPQVARADQYVKEDFLEQYYVNLQPNEKFSYLVHLLKTEDIGRGIIFCSTRANVEILTKNLKAQGIKAEMIHGKLRQSTRLSIMENFNKGKPNLLIASAVAARGLHVQGVTHIFNYNLSNDPQEYIHRVGRTARAGESGKAITLLESRDHPIFGQILDRYRLNVKELEKENFKKLRFMARSPQGRGFRGGRGNHSGRGYNRGARHEGGRPGRGFGSGRERRGSHVSSNNPRAKRAPAWQRQGR